MRIYHFSEEPYADAWGAERPSLRITLPNEVCDPVRANELYNRYIDEWMLADELGFDIMLNEHHSTATCLTSSANVMLAILARVTKRARLLVLGVPIGNRPDPVRVAEEMSIIDVISKGRLELGMIKGVPYDIEPANSNAVTLMPRFWEAHDLIIKAMTTTTGPFSFEGDFFHYRNVNIWPRPYQQPRPPIWVSTSTPSNAVEIGQRGHVMASFMGGIAETVKLHKAYAEGYRAGGNGTSVPVDRFAYLAMCGVASTEAEGRRRCDVIADYLRTNAQVADPFNKPPGYFSVETAMRSARSPNPRAFRTLMTPKGRPVELSTATLDDFIECGIAFAGTPDQVFNQICEFLDGIGGLGNLLLMGQGGSLSAADTTDSMKLFARDVMPRLKERQARTRVFEAA
jgi:alkanesulfonate monooxygenase SsuD/methylene tetrahydromethanopterin reductase-like flavin-dependent oxidoreductase (luciferase family)